MMMVTVIIITSIFRLKHQTTIKSSFCTIIILFYLVLTLVQADLYNTPGYTSYQLTNQPIRFASSIGLLTARICVYEYNLMCSRCTITVTV